MNNTSKSINSAAVIPFYNESKSINKIVESVLNYVDVVIAVDDGSTDNSIQNIPENNNVIILSNKKNRGKGSTLRKGFDYCIENNFDRVITIDADLQHDPESIPDLLKGLVIFDLVIGNRLKDLKSMPIQRKISNKLTSFLLSIKTSKKIVDSQCGFRAFRKSALEKILPEFPGYEAESEMIIKAVRNKLKIGFVDVPTIYTSEKSKMKPIRAIVAFIKILFI